MCSDRLRGPWTGTTRALARPRRRGLTPFHQCRRSFPTDSTTGSGSCGRRQAGYAIASLIAHQELSSPTSWTTCRSRRAGAHGATPGCGASRVLRPSCCETPRRSRRPCMGLRCSTTCCLPKSTSVISRRSGESILRLLISTGTSLPFGRRGPTRLESLTGKLEVCGAGSLAPRRRRLRPARNASSPTGLLTSRATTPTRSPTTVARKVVRDRERRQKGALARLGNPKRLSAWSGAAGAGALTFRWTTVRDIVLDIHAGLGRDA